MVSAAADPLVDNDSFVVRRYLPDTPAAQENMALVVYNGSTMLKLADVDWNFATGIELSSGYTSGSGDISSSDTVESAIEKLDGNVDNLTSAVGVSQGDTNMGTYTGSLINDNESAKQNIQQLESEAEAIRTLSGTSSGDTDLGTFPGGIIADNEDIKGALEDLEGAIEALPVPVSGEVTGITTITTINTFLVDSFDSAEWEIVVFEEATPANKKSLKISAVHDGTASADATDFDRSTFARNRVGSNFNAAFSIDLNGTGTSQTMRLRCSSSTAGVTVRFRRTTIL